MADDEEPDPSIDLGDMNCSKPGSERIKVSFDLSSLFLTVDDPTNAP